jgi:hypothetical protein
MPSGTVRGCSSPCAVSACSIMSERSAAAAMAPTAQLRLHSVRWRASSGCCSVTATQGLVSAQTRDARAERYRSEQPRQAHRPHDTPAQREPAQSPAPPAACAQSQRFQNHTARLGTHGADNTSLRHKTLAHTLAPQSGWRCVSVLPNLISPLILQSSASEAHTA